ncbi:MAG: hypothetical protein WAT39_06220 [Planctomycetota bacterium]
MNPLPCLALFAVLATSATFAVAQQPAPESTGWTEGFGRGVSYRAALAAALEDAVGKAKGIAVARAGAVRSRLAVVGNWSEDLKPGWFDGEAEGEREWVQQQIAGFVQQYEISKKGKADDGQWEVTVRAKIAALASGGTFVLDLDDDDLRKWLLERFEEGGGDAPFGKAQGTYEAPTIRENLRATGAVQFVAKSGGVQVGEGAAPQEREKQGHRVVASHRVVVRWQPMRFQSLVEKLNKARPTSGPRPQYLTAASVQVALKIVDLVRDVEVLERPLTVALTIPPGTPVERLDGMAVQLADQAKAAVAEAVFFALRPPVVARKWPGDDGKDWFVEVALAKRIAQAYDSFAIGNQGSLASPDWRSIGRAAFVGGTDASSTFRLVDVADPSLIEPGVTEVRPAKK